MLIIIQVYCTSSLHFSRWSPTILACGLIEASTTTLYLRKFDQCGLYFVRKRRQEHLFLPAITVRGSILQSWSPNLSLSHSLMRVRCCIFLLAMSAFAAFCEYLYFAPLISYVDRLTSYSLQLSFSIYILSRCIVALFQLLQSVNRVLHLSSRNIRYRSHFLPVAQHSS
jgi:hypothetical protein